MRQRNSTDQVLIVPAVPTAVAPGAVIDHPVLIVGFELVDELAPDESRTEVVRSPRSKRTPLTEGPAASS